MEKQKSLWSCRCRSTSRFLVLSFTLSFSLLLLSYLFSWAMQASPFIHQQEAYFLLNTSSSSSLITLELNPLNLPSFTDLPLTHTLNNTYLSNTQLVKKLSPLLGVAAANNSFTVSVSNSTSSSSKVNLRYKGSGYEVKVANLEGTHLRKHENASGFVVRGKVGGQASKLGNKVDERRGKVEVCDVSIGKWVFDESYPLYTNVSCPFIDEGFNCQANGRLDQDYIKWRWQPHDCHIPRFNATNMLELIRGKRLVFAGDSINRNQWESLLCLLMGAIKNPRKVYETRGRRITKNRGTYSFRFVDYQCTVEFHVSHFLVRESKAKVGKKRKATLRIDSVDRESGKWRGADILVFNTGNWWSHYKTKSGKNYYQEGNEVYPHLDPITAYRKALVTWAAWVDKNVNPQKTHIFFRSTAPAHFREGQWNTGGHCREARNPLSEAYVENAAKDIIAEEVISKMRIPVTFLNVSGLSSFRIDGHPSKYGKNIIGTGRSVEDCSHWCLPGVPDAWNELLYYQILVKQLNNFYVS